jgi:hypothetical protein
MPFAVWQEREFQRAVYRNTAAREHFSGWASHTAVLAGVPARSVGAVLFFAKGPWIAVVAAMVVVFAAAGIALDRAWRRRAT